MLVSAFAASLLKLCFGSGKEVPLPTGTTTILNTLVKGSPAEVKKVISRQGIKAAITQLQKLELPREERRRRNRLFVRCLALRQAEAFIKLKKFPNKETAQQIVDDFTHSPTSLIGKLKDKAEDLKKKAKKKYDDWTCTCSTGNSCCGLFRYKVDCCKAGPRPTKGALALIYPHLGR